MVDPSAHTSPGSRGETKNIETKQLVVGFFFFGGKKILIFCDLVCRQVCVFSAFDRLSI